VCARREVDEQQFPVAANCADGSTGQLHFERGRILDKIGLRAQADAQDAAARQRGAQAASDSFDFGKFRHLEI